jgi:predicted DNA-binding protein (UPF0251 family)
MTRPTPDPKSQLERLKITEKQPAAIKRLMAKIDELGVKGAAEHYGVHRATVHRWVGRKK